jgi:Flp pilus assembly protein TadD
MRHAMPNYPFLTTARAAGFMLLAVAAMPSAAIAQYIGAAPPPPAAPVPGMIEDPTSALARNIRLLALAPRSFDALIGAGRAALALGDAQAAVGFFGRAEEVSPRSPAPKAGTAAALVAMEQPNEALGYFAEAMRLGATQASIGADRGLAYDLTGEPSLAQADYRAAFYGPDGPEAHRRLALSLAMGHDRTGALAAIAPLMSRRDPATERVRAFVLAMVGDVAGAKRVVEAAMPGAAANMEPFLYKLSRMSPDQQVAAVHFGRFPDDSAIKLAAVAPPPVPSARAPAPAPATRIMVTPPSPRKGETAKIVRRARPEEMTSRVPLDMRPKPIYSRRPAATTAVPQQRPPVAAPIASIAVPAPPPAPAATPSQPQLAAPSFNAEPAQPPPVEVAAVTPAPSSSSVSAADRLSEIDRLLGSVEEPVVQVAEAPTKDELAAVDTPPPSRPKAETAAEKRAAKKGKAKPVDVVEEASTLGKKAKPAPKVAKSPGKYWVQLAGGSLTERMPNEFKRIKGKKPALFTKRTAYVAELKGWTRLLVGPFKSEDAAQEYVNQLAKANIDGFSWTSPTSQTIEKLSAK